MWFVKKTYHFFSLKIQYQHERVWGQEPKFGSRKGFGSRTSVWQLRHFFFLWTTLLRIELVDMGDLQEPRFYYLNQNAKSHEIWRFKISHYLFTLFWPNLALVLLAWIGVAPSSEEASETWGRATLPLRVGSLSAGGGASCGMEAPAWLPHLWHKNGIQWWLVQSWSNGLITSSIGSEKNFVSFPWGFTFPLFTKLGVFLSKFINLIFTD